MLTDESEKDLLEIAQLAERLCDWSNALKLYNQAAELYLSREMLDEAAQTYKKLGYAKIYSAFTGETLDEVIESKNKAIKYFEKAKMLFNQSLNKYGVMECKVGVFMTKWEFGASFPEIIKAVEKTRDLLLQLIDFYNKKDEKENLAAALALLARLALLPSPKPVMERNEIYQKGIDYANRSWKISKETGNSRIIADSLNWEWSIRITQVYSQGFRGNANWGEIYRELLNKCNDTLELIENKEDYGSLVRAYFIYGIINWQYGFYFIEDEEIQKEFTEKGLSYLEMALDMARKINDKYFIGGILVNIDFFALFAGKIDYLQKRLSADILEVEDVEKLFIGFPFYGNLVSIYSTIARWSFYNHTRRKAYAEKAIEYGEKFIKNLSDTENSEMRRMGTSIPPGLVYSALTSSYSQLAFWTSDIDKQGLYLQKMLDNANKAYELGQKAKGGFIRAWGALAKRIAYKTLADLAKNENDKVKFLTISIEMAKNHIVHTIESRTGMITAQLRIGLLLEELGILSLNNDILQEAKEYLEKE